AELNRLGRETVGGGFTGEILLLKAETCCDGNALTKVPRILQEEPMIDTGRVPVGTVILHVSIAVGARAGGTSRIAVLRTIGRYEGLTIQKCRKSRCFVQLRRVKQNSRLIPALKYVVGKTVHLVTEFKVMSAPQSAFEPSNILVELDILIGTPDGCV